jgi:hypothetical protein
LLLMVLKYAIFTYRPYCKDRCLYQYLLEHNPSASGYTPLHTRV